MAKSRGLTVYMAIRITIMEKVILSANRRSSRYGGSGITMTIKMPTTPKTIAESLLLDMNDSLMEPDFEPLIYATLPFSL
jgi:hypothetical protein